LPRACLSEAAEADILLLYVEQEKQHLGALLDAGAALGAGKWVCLCSPHLWPFLRNHPRVRSFDNVAEAVRITGIPLPPPIVCFLQLRT
jgi:hypothetical protein